MELFCGENFRGMLKPIMVGMARPNFVEKTFMSGSGTAKFVEVFSLKNFSLYSISYELMPMSDMGGNSD